VTPVARRLVFVVALCVAFVAGIGLGEALHDRPDLSDRQTLVRTLTPLPAGITTETITVTTSNP
jgi:hypothetical protein